MGKELLHTNYHVSRRFKISAKRVSYEKHDGDACYAEIYKGQELVGQVFFNSCTDRITGADLRMLEKDSTDRRAYFYADEELPQEEQILDAINNTIFIIAKNDLFFKSIPG